MIVLIDNYDSFTYNLYQLLGQFDPDITPVRNDEKNVEEIAAMNPDHIIISPGPGRPADAGICEQAISREKYRSSASAWAIRPCVKPTVVRLPTPKS